jgi:hypothetical protein
MDLINIPLETISGAFYWGKAPELGLLDWFWKVVVEESIEESVK